MGKYARVEFVCLVIRRSGVKPLSSAHLGMCLKTCSPGRPKPCEEKWVDDYIIEKTSHTRWPAYWYGCTRSLRCPKGEGLSSLNM